MKTHLSLLSGYCNTRFNELIVKEEKDTLKCPVLKRTSRRAHRFDFLRIPVSLPRDDMYLTANHKIKELADKYQHVEYIDLTRLPLFDAAPMYQGRLIYHDEHHLNEIGSKIYVQQAAAYLRDLGLFEALPII